MILSDDQYQRDTQNVKITILAISQLTQEDH